MAKRVFIAYPMSVDVQSDMNNVIEICRSIHSDEIIPVTPSLISRLYLGDSPEDIELAEAVNAEYFGNGFIDEVWVYGTHLTKEMKEDLRLATMCGITIIGQTPETVIALAALGLDSKRLAGVTEP